MIAFGQENVTTVAVLGSGLIGSGWAARFLAHGLDVRAWDPDPAAEKGLRENVERAWPLLTELGVSEDADQERLSFETSMECCLAGAQFVQENAPDDVGIKSEIIASASRICGADVMIASSSSGIRPSLLQNEARHPGRILVGHPFNPVYLLPLVEVVGGEQTTDSTITRACAFYRALGMRPMHTRVEVDGYISDRLQQVLFHEALYMIRDGVCTPAEIDAAITGGPGLRWAFIGPMLTFHLAGGKGGLRRAMQHWSPEETNLWTHLPAPDLSDELVEAAAGGCELEQGKRTLEELETRRDRCLAAIQKALDDFWYPPGEDGWPESPA